MCQKKKKKSLPFTSRMALRRGLEFPWEFPRTHKKMSSVKGEKFSILFTDVSPEPRTGLVT